MSRCGTWPDERVERMSELRASGLSTAAVGLALGTTKNAVVGKLDRLGMLNNAPVPTLHDRLDALDAAFDRVLGETPR